MKKMLDRLFSEAYVNRKTVGDNLLLLLMYRFAYPFSVLLDRLRLSPNQITSLSLGFSVFAFTALILDEGWVWFSIFWGLAVLLDFCDGTVARMADKVSKSAFRYDHMSDLFKISLVILGVGLRHNDAQVWVMAFLACFTFLYSDALNRELHIAIARQTANGSGKAADETVRIRDRYSIVAWLAKHEVLFAMLRNTYAVLLTVNGHTLLLFFLVPLGRAYALCVFSYLTSVGLWTIRSRIFRLLAMCR